MVQATVHAAVHRPLVSVVHVARSGLDRCGRPVAIQSSAPYCIAEDRARRYVRGAMIASLPVWLLEQPAGGFLAIGDIAEMLWPTSIQRMALDYPGQCIEHDDFRFRVVVGSVYVRLKPSSKA